MSDNNSTSGGIGAGMLLFLVFLVLKLCHVIDWSWWWVTAPLWGSVVLAILIVIVFQFFIKWIFRH